MSSLRKIQPTTLFGTVTLAVIVLAIVVGPLVYPQSAEAIDFSLASQPPSLIHPFGTNTLGQDQLARVMLGGRISLTVGIAAMAMAVSFGTLVGAIAGFYGGLLDSLLMRFTDLFLSLPQLPLSLLVIYLFGDHARELLGPQNGIFALVVLVIGGFNWMSVARLVRAGFLANRDRTFMQAVNALGAKPRRLIWHHLLPNVLGPVIVAATLAVGNAVLAEATLSFLGLGFPPDVPTWGRMLFTAQDYLDSAPHMAIFPGAAIFLTVLSINFIGDGLRDSLGPN
ncbi:ABC transporter permease [Leptothoe kymatousa]|uniref:ABC transporter permease n=1 Tax=Leptothoe kymatousa TAU-MAC 1615 TaxID=2364775 RepID=A0ABS5Y0L4_9CYAN|nr:ABC transporter permease [Leptothoe kymatousa]MBT9311146.1 ABC transporter permease [Leptothoe kymatousa TAU-MAC 1615]